MKHIFECKISLFFLNWAKNFSMGGRIQKKKCGYLIDNMERYEMDTLISPIRSPSAIGASTHNQQQTSRVTGTGTTQSSFSSSSASYGVSSLAEKQYPKQQQSSRQTTKSARVVSYHHPIAPSPLLMMGKCCSINARTKQMQLSTVGCLFIVFT